MAENLLFTAWALWRSVSPEIEESIRRKFADLDLGITAMQVNGTGSKAWVIFGCEPEHFERVFNTHVERVPEKTEPGSWTPSHFALLEPVTIPPELEEELEDVFLPEPASTAETLRS